MSAPLRTRPCEVRHLKTQTLYHRLFAETGDFREIYDDCHRWDGQLCAKCGQTRRQVMTATPRRPRPVRVGWIAREIAAAVFRNRR